MGKVKSQKNINAVFGFSKQALTKNPKPEETNASNARIMQYFTKCSQGKLRPIPQQAIVKTIKAYNKVTGTSITFFVNM